MLDFLRLEKFPVVSESGREYRVVIEDGEHSFCKYIVKLYVDKGRRWFRFKKVKEIYAGQEWNGQMKRLAIHIINEYEISRWKNLEGARKHKEGIDEFREWDGNCIP